MLSFPLAIGGCSPSDSQTLAVLGCSRSLLASDTVIAQHAHSRASSLCVRPAVGAQRAARRSDRECEVCEGVILEGRRTVESGRRGAESCGWRAGPQCAVERAEAALAVLCLHLQAVHPLRGAGGRYQLVVEMHEPACL